MKSKSIFSIILIITLLTISLFAAGCTDNGSDGSIVDVTPTATPTQTPTEQPTVESTEEPTAEATDGIEVPNMARIDAYLILPAGGMKINVGEIVTFRNFDSSKLTRVLVSEDGIWEEDQSLKYMRTVSYTFNEPGTYTFHLKGRETKKWILTVE
jgi:plastocyanin